MIGMNVNDHMSLYMYVVVFVGNSATLSGLAQIIGCCVAVTEGLQNECYNLSVGLLTPQSVGLSQSL